jgi:DNA-binding IclR family transcriptional regulator
MRQLTDEPRVIEAVDRALSILECFSKQRPELGVTEISRLLNLHKSTVFRCLASLEARGLVTRNEITQRYSLGPKVLALAGTYMSSADVREKARPMMQELRAQTNETVSLWVAAGDRCVCIERFESPSVVRRVLHVGDHLPLHLCSPGRLLMAYMPAAKLAELVASIPIETRSIAADPETLEEHLALIRERRAAFASMEAVPDAASVSAPVFNAAGEMVVALTIGGPASRFSGEQVGIYAKLAREAAAEVSRQMGHGI